MDPLYWPQPGWVQFQLWYLEVPGLLVTILQFCLVQCYKEIQYLLQNKMSTCDMCSAWSCFNSRESGFAVTNEKKITPKRTNILRMYLLNCCFGLNKNDDFDNYESTISGEPYMWRNQDYHWDVTLDFNLCGTAPWTDIHHHLFIYLFYLFYLNHYLNHGWLIVTFVTKNNGNDFLTLEQLHTFQTFFFQIVILFSNTVHYGYDISPHKKVTSQRPQTSQNSLGLVKICDGLLKFKHGYRETRIWN